MKRENLSQSIFSVKQNYTNQVLDSLLRSIKFERNEKKIPRKIKAWKNPARSFISKHLLRIFGKILILKWKYIYTVYFFHLEQNPKGDAYYELISK